MADNDLNEEVVVEVDDASVITVPIDDTLSNSGEAADAKAVGDALAGKADRSELQTAVRVNGQQADAQGLIIVTAADTKMSSTDDTTVKSAIETVDGKTAADIKMSSDPSAETIAQAIQSAAANTADQIKMSSSDATTVKSHIDTLEGNVTDLNEAVDGLDKKTGASIKYAATGDETIKAHVDALEGVTVKSVNNITPDNAGNVKVDTVPYADNIRTDDMEQVDGAFLCRTAGGSLAINGNSAWLLRLRGNRVHTGYVEEQLNLQVIPMPRTTPPAITATLDEATFEAYVEEAGTYTLSYDGEDWDNDPADYGLTISNIPVDGDVITIVWDGENDATVSITAGPRTAPPAITATIDRDTFVAYVSDSSTIILTYTTEWSADPSLYGVTVSNIPIAGDQIKIVYVKEVRGTITQANPTTLKATGWNLYNHAAGYARVVKYSEVYGYAISGTYTSIGFGTTPDAASPTPITPDEDGLFDVPSDGYVFVTGGDSTSTAIWPTWSDWEEGYSGSFAAYTESTVNLATIMSNLFPNGLCKVGDVYDEIDVNAKEAISRVTRMQYSEQNRATAKASGRAYEFDEDYIYIARATEIVTEITLDEAYTVDDHGLEIFAGSVPVYAEILYGVNLKDKLRRDVVTFRMTVSQLKGMGS